MSRWPRLVKEVIAGGLVILQWLYHDLKESNQCGTDHQELFKIVVIIDSQVKVITQVTVTLTIGNSLFRHLILSSKITVIVVI